EAGLAVTARKRVKMGELAPKCAYRVVEFSPPTNHTQVLGTNRHNTGPLRRRRSTGQIAANRWFGLATNIVLSSPASSKRLHPSCNMRLRSFFPNRSKARRRTSERNSRRNLLSRRLGLEPLETRQMLSVTLGPINNIQVPGGKTVLVPL